jgi:peptidoglycan-associated lipoprotein
VEGHCDQRGSDALNDRLGEARADAAARFLVRRGVMPERIESASFGKRRPICAESTEACHTQNRRAELRDVTSAAASAVRSGARSLADGL